MDQPTRTEETQDEIKRLAAEYEGDYYFRARNHEKALEQYARAKNEKKIRALAEWCVKNGEGKGARAAYVALGEKPSNAEWKVCGDVCLKEGRLTDALFAYGEGDLVHELADPLCFVVCHEIDRDQFRECGDICRAKGDIQNAARAYEVAERPLRIVAMADDLLKKGTLSDVKEAKLLYARAACIEIEIQAHEELRRKLNRQAEEYLKGKGMSLFTSEELEEMARSSEAMAEAIAFVGRTPKTPREPLIVDIPSTIGLVIEQVRRENGEMKIDANTPEEEIEFARVLAPERAKTTSKEG